MQKERELEYITFVNACKKLEKIKIFKNVKEVAYQFSNFYGVPWESLKTIKVEIEHDYWNYPTCNWYVDTSKGVKIIDVEELFPDLLDKLK